MGVGAISAIGTYQPYVYRTNQVSSRSLSKVAPIGEDLLKSKTDFSGLTKEENETINPLKRGQTAHFADVLSMQMQMGRMNAQRLIKPVETQEDPVFTGSGQQQEASLYQARRATESYSAMMV